ncbi:MAG TPA: divalent metal cation transporter [Xanthobacteraceae bacterium]|nr:divalent metal cation transporter [Xanthobacteraceae bacterium]
MKSIGRLLRALGPGVTTGAADDDPSGIATYSQAGAEFGFALNWTMLLSYPLMAAVQEISARIGRTTGKGIAANIHEWYPTWLLQPLIGLLLVANAINIGADLGAMADAIALLIGGPRLLYVALFSIFCATLPIVVDYRRYAAILKWFTLALFAYFGVLLTVQISWQDVAAGLFLPTFAQGAAFWTMVVAILGTTISPYLFFWQASQEVEEIRAVREHEPLVKVPRQGPRAIRRIRFDTLFGMALSNLVALAIMITTGATLHETGVYDIQSSSQAAEALRPIAGSFAFAVFALGIVGTGLLAVPVLAGSAAYALAEACRLPASLTLRPKDAKGFHATIALITVGSGSINLAGFSPVKALVWSAVVNGVVAVPMLITMMNMAASPRIMGKFTVERSLRFMGWLATAVMGIATGVMVVTALS